MRSKSMGVSLRSAVRVQSRCSVAAVAAVRLRHPGERVFDVVSASHPGGLLTRAAGDSSAHSFSSSPIPLPSVTAGHPVVTSQRRLSAIEEAREEPAPLRSCRGHLCGRMLPAAPFGRRDDLLDLGNVLSAPRPRRLSAGATLRSSAHHDTSSLRMTHTPTGIQLEALYPHRYAESYPRPLQRA